MRIFALLVAVAALAIWGTLGANRGWTRTSERVETVDEVTGLTGIEYRKKFVPGLDFLGGALLAAGALAGASIFFTKQQDKTKTV